MGAKCRRVTGILRETGRVRVYSEGANFLRGGGGEFGSMLSRENLREFWFWLHFTFFFMVEKDIMSCQIN